MKPATPKMRYFAERLIAHEGKGNPSSRKATPTAVPVIDKLRPHLATLMGNTGFQALLSRALALAAHEIPWLAELRVEADGTLKGLTEAEKQVTPEEMTKGGVVVLARLLGLLVAFIGEVLTIGLVREVWPRLPLDDYFETGDDK